jgi:hypothetical protein
MKGFWKWFLISLGILFTIAIAFCVTMFFLRGGVQHGAFDRGLYGSGMMRGRLGGYGGYGGMMFGFGAMMFLRMLFPLGILVLAGFGVAALVRRPGHPVLVPATMSTCKSCGKPLATEWKTCPHCGTPVQAEETAPVIEKTKKTKAS